MQRIGSDFRIEIDGGTTIGFLDIKCGQRPISTRYLLRPLMAVQPVHIKRAPPPIHSAALSHVIGCYKARFTRE